MTSIGDLAFETCLSLTSIFIPDSVVFISDIAFCKCVEHLDFTVPQGSYAAEYAKAKGISHTFGAALAGDSLASGNPSSSTEGGEAIASENAGERESGDYIYTVADGRATVTGYTGSAAELSVPSRLDGYPVTAIDHLAFKDCVGLIP